MSLTKLYFKKLYNDTVHQYSIRLFSLLEHNPKAKILDLGCWDGSNALKFSKRIGSKNLLGVDTVQAAVSKTRAKGFNAVSADLNRNFSFSKSNKFDVLIANHTIEHLHDIHTFVKEAYRVLKPGGYFVIGTPNLASWHNLFALGLGNQPYSCPVIKRGSLSELKSEKNTRLTNLLDGSGEEALGHIIVLTYSTLIKLLELHGFKIEAGYGFGYYPFPSFLSKTLQRLDKSHSHYMLVKARKL